MPLTDAPPRRAVLQADHEPADGDKVAGHVGCVLTITGVPPAAPTNTGLARPEHADRRRDHRRILGVLVVRSANGRRSRRAGTGFVINGVPFSGTGFGYNPATGRLRAKPSNGAARPLALCRITWTNRNPPGGANSDYTAADFQHMLLAAQVTNATGGRADASLVPSAGTDQLLGSTSTVCHSFQTSTDLGAAESSNYVGRSAAADRSAAVDQRRSSQFHRAAIRSVDRLGIATAARGTWTTTATGCRTAFGSIWACRSARPADGRLYKPLFAILCVDLDGRLNLNAHGSLAQTDTTDTERLPRSPHGLSTVIRRRNDAQPRRISRGQGYGPADINLSSILPLTPRQLISGSHRRQRYIKVATDSSERARRDQSIDPIWRNNWIEYESGTGNYWSFITVPATATVNDAGSYGTPPDPFGFGAIGLDLAGRPLWIILGGNYSGSARCLNNCRIS